MASARAPAPHAYTWSVSKWQLHELYKLSTVHATVKQQGLHQSYPINYKELSDVNIPRIRQLNAARDQELNDTKCTTGYGHSFRKDKEGIVSLEEDALDGGQDSCTIHSASLCTVSLQQELKHH